MKTDSEIIASSAENPELFAALFDRHARGLLAYARGRIGTDHADDVVSETFLVAFRRRKDFDSRWDSAKPWLYGIATRLIRKLSHREWANQAAVRSVTAEGNVSSDGALPAAELRLDAQARLASLQPRIAALPPKEREALLLYAWGGLSYQEIARALGVPIGTVRSRLNRARRALQAPPIRAIDVARKLTLKEERNVILTEERNGAY